MYYTPIQGPAGYSGHYRWKHDEGQVPRERSLRVALKQTGRLLGSPLILFALFLALLQI